MRPVPNSIGVQRIQRGFIIVLLAAGLFLQGTCSGPPAAPDSEASPADGSFAEGDGIELDGVLPDSTGDPVDERWDGGLVVPATCGDGVVDPGEECDDGNRLNGDDCDWACRSGPGAPPPDVPLPELAESGSLSLLVSSTDIELGDLERNTFISAERQPLVWTGTHYAAVALIEDWDDSPTTSSELQFVKFGRDSIRSGPGWRLHEPGRPFGMVDLAWNGEGFGLVWTNWTDSTIWFVELDADGKPLFSVVALAEATMARNVSLVWNDGRYAVFWVEGTVPPTDESHDSVRFLSFDRHGQRTIEPLDLFRSDEPTVVRQLDSATSGERDIVIFLAGGPAGYRVDDQPYAFWAAVTAAGTLLSRPTRVGPADGRAGAVAWDQRSAFGFAWVRSDYDPGLHLARVGLDGALLGPPRPVGEPVAIPADPLSQINPTDLSMAFGAGGWALAFPQVPSNPMCRRHAGLVRTDRVGTLTDLSCLDDVLETTQAFGDVVFDGEGFGWLHNRHDGLRLIRWLVGP